MPKRRWYQFSLRNLLVGTTVIAAALSLTLICIAPAERQRKAVLMVHQLGGRALYETSSSEDSWPSRELRKWLPRDYFDTVVIIELNDTPTTDGDLAALEELRQLRQLDLSRTLVTDRGLAHLHGLTGLVELLLRGSHATDSGLVSIQGLKDLAELDLDDTAVTDAGMVQLQGLTNLQDLRLCNTQVTAQGLARLRGLARLTHIYLQGSQVTNAGAEDFRESLPGCSIVRNKIYSPGVRTLP